MFLYQKFDSEPMDKDAFNNSALEKQIQTGPDAVEKHPDVLEVEREYGHEIRRYSVIESSVLALLAVIVMLPLLYLLSATIVTRTDVLFFISSILIVPAGIFLLCFHFFDM